MRRFSRFSAQFQISRSRILFRVGAAQAALCCLALAMLVGCATPAPMSGPGAPAPDSFAGEPVDDVRFARLIEWRPVDRDHLMLRFDRNRYVLVEPMDPCFANLREAEGMRLVQSVSNRLHISDRLLIDGRECRIVSIRPFYFVEWATAVSEAAQDDSGGM